MTTKIERLLRSAYAYSSVINASTSSSSSTRPSTTNTNLYEESKEEFLSTLNSTTAEDFNLPQSISQLERTHAPAAYMHIHENNWFSLGIFVIFNGGQIPLHDHPGMDGALKVIAGSVKVSSYTVINRQGSYITVTSEPSVVLNSSSAPTVLKPQAKNIHQIDYVTGDTSHDTKVEPQYASFVDFLTPPYGLAPRLVTEDECNYYEKLDTSSSSSVTTLRKCKASSQYWTVDLPYTGVPLRDVIFKMRSQYPESH